MLVAKSQASMKDWRSLYRYETYRDLISPETLRREVTTIGHTYAISETMSKSLDLIENIMSFVRIIVVNSADSQNKKLNFGNRISITAKISWKATSLSALQAAYGNSVMLLCESVCVSSLGVVQHKWEKEVLSVNLDALHLRGNYLRG